MSRCVLFSFFPLSLFYLCYGRVDIELWPMRGMSMVFSGFHQRPVQEAHETRKNRLTMSLIASAMFRERQTLVVLCVYRHSSTRSVKVKHKKNRKTQWTKSGSAPYNKVREYFRATIWLVPLQGPCFWPHFVVTRTNLRLLLHVGEWRYLLGSNDCPLGWVRF